MKVYQILILIIFIFNYANSQPKTPVEKWSGKTILLVGAHPDDDYQSHGTLALLNKNSNRIFILTLTTGNVGTKDLSISKNDLSIIRRKEQIEAMKVLGLSKDQYINLGYDAG